jgi:structural maintenance of chromosome 2
MTYMREIHQQFIVVSLKEGLFTNANVLFRARFRDGTSVVEVSPSPVDTGTPLTSILLFQKRTATRSTSAQAVEDKENRSEPTTGKGKKTAPARTARIPLVQV